MPAVMTKEDWDDAVSKVPDAELRELLRVEIQQHEDTRAEMAKRIADERRRLKLWLHLVSEHKAQMDPFEPLESLEDMHKHEHTGPGTLGKGEPVEPLPFNMRSVGEVFSEGDEDGSPWDQDK